MNGFISHIINRHQFTDVNVAPRLPGRFEPPAAPYPHAWLQNGVATETMQTAIHSDQDLQPADSPMLPAAVRVQKIGYMTGEENLQPSFIRPVPGKNDASPGEQTNAVKSGPLTQHSIQNTVAAGIPPALQSGLPFVYDPLQLNQHVKEGTGKKTIAGISPDILKQPPEMPGIRKPYLKEETGEKNIPVVSPDVSAPAKQDSRQPSSGITPIPVGFPSLRNSNTALRFSTGRLQEQQQPQVIKVSIGRIEVRAVQATGHGHVKAARVETPKPKMSLDEYLNKRNSSR